MASSRTRVTGMNSGLDTESIISQLVEARKTKVDKVKKDQMKLEYKQNAWKDLNKKLKGLQSTISNLQYESSYSKRKTTVSNPNVASVVTSGNAMVATQQLKVTKLASSAYLTGNKVQFSDAERADEKMTSGTLLSEIGVSEGESLTIEVGGKSSTIEVTEGMTLGNLASKVGEKTGLACNFDSATQRFFIGSKESGEAGNFTISGSAADKLGLDVDPDSKQWIKGSNGKIELNGVEYESNTNTFEVNGLTITTSALTDDQGVTLTTTKDTSAMYDMIKKFVNQYTELINEMDKMYGAETKTKYEPLTDEEKYAMSDKEAEKWEEKLKEQILAKDSGVRTISNSLSEIFNMGFKVGDKTMYLFDFGVETAGYFNSADNEKHALHIKGDEDDEMFSSETNTLKYMIESDADAVTSFFSQLNNELYKKMNEMSRRIEGYRSFGNFFDDVKMKSDYTDYNSKISDMEKKLQDYEDKWYDKFAAMEKAMSKMQSNTNAITSMLG